MGGWLSSDSKAEETKTVDSSGVINNTFITNDRLQTHNPEIIILLSIIAAVHSSYKTNQEKNPEE